MLKFTVGMYELSKYMTSKRVFHCISIIVIHTLLFMNLLIYKIPLGTGIASSLTQVTLQLTKFPKLSVAEYNCYKCIYEYYNVFCCTTIIC